MDIHQILDYLPHRYPFLLVDKVVSCEPGKGIVAIKNVTINEHFFAVHFPHQPVMPGDTLELNVEIKRFARGIWWFATRAKVDGQVVTEADLMCTLRTIDS